MTFAKVDQSLKQLKRGAATGGHVRVVHPHQFDAFERQLLQSVEVGLPTGVLAQVVGENLGFGKSAHRGVCGVSRIRHQHAVAGVDEC